MHMTDLVLLSVGLLSVGLPEMKPSEDRQWLGLM